MNQENLVEYSSVSIPKPLHDKIKKLIEGSGFRSVSEYTIFLLRESISAWGEKESNLPGKKSMAEDRIRRKLEALGYI